jgi:hypothetical protein
MPAFLDAGGSGANNRGKIMLLLLRVSGISNTGNGVFGRAPCGIGVRGGSACGTGVYGGASCGTGVHGYSDFSYGVVGQSCGGTGVLGFASDGLAIPLVAKGSTAQIANLQQWQIGCSTPLSVVNSSGWLGLGSSNAPTTLTVGGSVSARTVVATANYKMGSSDFAVLASGKIKATLPPASTATGMIVFVKNTSTSTVTIEAFKNSKETDTIEGAASEALKKQYDSLQLISDGTNEWYILGNSKCGAFVS